ncbi:MAG: hypothetical protein KAU21_10830, partial [Gammaproteobacteria bacterium]|nr:hypothetical protein [Gammaproteobacteria bacterium]
MAVIRISRIKPDQEVAIDVKDRSGRVLLSAGTKLTEKTIKIIKSWGVMEIDVLGDVAETENNIEHSNIDTGAFQLLELELSNRFRFLNKNHPFISELYDIC